MHVIGYHLILTFYGFWLPNDPRGSWSDFVRAWELRRFGPATTTTERRSHAWDPHDVALRREAKQHLARPQVHLTGVQARAVATGFGTFVRRSGILIYACSILPEHAHLVIGRHHYSIEEIGRHLKADATTQLKREGLHPFADDVYQDGNPPHAVGAKVVEVFSVRRGVPRERGPLRPAQPAERTPAGAELDLRRALRRMTNRLTMPR